MINKRSIFHTTILGASYSEWSQREFLAPNVLNKTIIVHFIESWTFNWSIADKFKTKPHLLNETHSINIYFFPKPHPESSIRMVTPRSSRSNVYNKRITADLILKAKYLLIYERNELGGLFSTFLPGDRKHAPQPTMVPAGPSSDIYIIFSLKLRLLATPSDPTLEAWWSH
jgi:hypothetical protein